MLLTKILPQQKDFKDSSHNCGVHSCEKKRSKKMKLLISGKKWIKGIVRTTSKIRKMVCKLLFERRTSNKLGDKFRVLWGNFQTCPLPVQLHKTKRPGGQGPSRSPSGLDPRKWQNPQGRGHSWADHQCENTALPRWLSTCLTPETQHQGKGTHSFPSGSIKYMAFEWKITQTTNSSIITSNFMNCMHRNLQEVICYFQKLLT